MDRTVKLLLLSLLLAGVTVAQTRNLGLSARLNNTGIFHNRLNGSSFWSLGKQRGQKRPWFEDQHPQTIGASSSSQVSPYNPSQGLEGSQGTAQNTGDQPQRGLFGGTLLNGFVQSALSSFNLPRPGILGQRGIDNPQRLEGSLGTLQNTSEVPQRGLFGDRPLDGFIQSALSPLNSSRSGIFGQNGIDNPQRLRGSLQTSQNTGGLFRLRPLVDRFDNSVLPRSNSSTLGQNRDRIQHHNGGSTEASQNIQLQSASEDGSWGRFIPVLSRFNGGHSTSAEYGTGSVSADSSGNSASEASGDRSATSSDESGSSGGYSS